MTNLPTIGSYMNSSSRNYGVNSLYFDCDAITVYFSYSTPVAFRTAKTSLVCRVNDWSATTGKHLNEIQPDKAKRIPGDTFETILRHALTELDINLPNVA